ncbi:MAG: SDR family oxidoreductase, partial [Cyanobacteria bacterium P01_F01_bin.42]
MTESAPSPVPSPIEASDRVLVAGATGGVGQLTVGKLVEHKIPVRAMTRERSKAERMFDDRVEIAIADTRTPKTLESAMKGVTHIICCTGTTAFPSERWEFDLSGQSELEKIITWARLIVDQEYRMSLAHNGPQQVDCEGVKALVNAAPADLKRFILVSSIGVTRRTKPPFSILNAFGVLDAKVKGEDAVIQSELPYTIVRPGRLIDGPFTSFDLNTLLKATTDGKRGVVIGTGDLLNGDTSRIDVAAACVVALKDSQTQGKLFEIISRGDRPKSIDW